MMALRDFLVRVEARKAALGLSETAAETEALRNKGGRRTAEKRALLELIEERSRELGLASSVISYRGSLARAG